MPARILPPVEWQGLSGHPCVPQMLSSVTADMGTLSMALPFEGYCTCAYKAEDALVIAATLGVKMSSLF